MHGPLVLSHGVVVLARISFRGVLFRGGGRTVRDRDPSTKPGVDLYLEIGRRPVQRGEGGRRSLITPLQPPVSVSLDGGVGVINGRVASMNRGVVTINRGVVTINRGGVAINGGIVTINGGIVTTNRGVSSTSGHTVMGNSSVDVDSRNSSRVHHRQK
eukprot:2486877-Rhodomonas_salina.2